MPQLPPEIRPSKRLDYIYREYERLNQQVESYIQGSFADFKLLAALGGVVPLLMSSLALHAYDENPTTELEVSTLMTFVGFLSGLAVVAILAFRDLIKQALIFRLMEHLRYYERMLQDQLGLHGTGAFEINTRWGEYLKRQHMPIVMVFQFVFVMAIGGVPTLVLAFVQQGTPNFALIYAGVCLATFLLLLVSQWLLRRCVT